MIISKKKVPIPWRRETNPSSSRTRKASRSVGGWKVEPIHLENLNCVHSQLTVSGSGVPEGEKRAKSPLGNPRRSYASLSKSASQIKTSCSRTRSYTSADLKSSRGKEANRMLLRGIFVPRQTSWLSLGLLDRSWMFS